MFETLTSWLSGRPLAGSARHAPAQRARLKVENLEGRDCPSAFVSGTFEPAPANVQYVNPLETVYSQSGIWYRRDGNGIVYDYNASASRWQPILTGIKEFAVAAQAWTTPGDDFVALHLDGNMEWGTISAPSWLPRTLYTNPGWSQFQLGSDGSVDSLTAGGFFAHWSGGTPTVMLGNVAKFEVSPNNNTLYTLQYGGSYNGFEYGNLTAWHGASASLVSSTANNFAVDSYGNIVDVNYLGQVYSDGVYQGTDGLGAASNNYANDGSFKWQLGYDPAGNLTWHQPYSWGMYT